MGIKTSIEYCDSTCNPAPFCSGCELYHRVPGKNHCYAANLVNRYKGLPGWPKHFNEPTYFLERMEEALAWADLTGTDRPGKPWLNGQPRVIFLEDMGDGFSPLADPNIWLTPFLNRIERSNHIWLVLSKWPSRMVEYFEQNPCPENLYVGTSITTRNNQFRVKDLAQVFANVKWLSLEPLLESIFLYFVKRPYLSYISGVICGGESGSIARPLNPDHVRSLFNLCFESNTPFFFKQWGSYCAPNQMPQDTYRVWDYHHGTENCWTGNEWDKFKVGKKAAGRLLDGREWNQLPWGNKL